MMYAAIFPFNLDSISSVVSWANFMPMSVSIKSNTKGNLKKLIRSVQFLLPGFVDKKFAIQNWFDKKTGHVFKNDLKGLKHFGLRGKLLVDVGAHRGQSIVAFRNIVPNCRIISFEPNTALAERLCQQWGGSVQIENCALSDSPGTLSLYVPYYGKFLFDGLASIHQNEAKDWFNSERFFG